LSRVWSKAAMVPEGVSDGLDRLRYFDQRRVGARGRTGIGCSVTSGRGCLHLDRLSRGADLQLRAHAQRLVRLQDNVGLLEGLETSRLDPHLVMRRGERREDLVTGAVRGDGSLAAGVEPRDGDGGTRNRGARRVQHRPRDRSMLLAEEWKG
jgi:hypothetical protein